MRADLQCCYPRLGCTVALGATAAMAGQLQEIQQLMQDEKQAVEMSEACKSNNCREKQAKEAQVEIKQYCLQREKEFKAKEAVALGSMAAAAVKWERPKRRRPFSRSTSPEQQRGSE